MIHKRQLVSVQYARAGAALLVVYAHLFSFAPFANLGLPAFGGVGVDLFFVISGYLMWETANNVRLWEFIKRRVVRIVPAYWFFTLLLVATSIIAPRLTPKIEFTLIDLLASLFFIPYTDGQGRQNPILLQGWTLNYEVYFYALFAIALLFAKNKRIIFLGLILCLSPFVGMAVSSKTAWIQMITSSIVMEFFLGVLLARWLPAVGVKPKLATALLISGLAGLIAGDLASAPNEFRALVCGLPAVLFLAGLISLEPLLLLRSSRWLLLIGNISYSLYLCHPFALNASNILTKYIGARTQMQGALLGVTFAFFATIASILAAWLSWKFIEIGSLRLMRKVHTSKTTIVTQKIIKSPPVENELALENSSKPLDVREIGL